MTKYVDREKVEARLKAYADNAPFGDVIKGLIDAVVFDLTGAIKDIPAADVRENVSAKWEYVGFMAVGCSNCHETFYELTSDNYCPNCGADMRGDNE